MKLLSYIFAFVVLTASCPSHAAICDAYQTPKPYADLKAQLEQKMKEFSNKKVIASRADEMLSKLLTAKSPVISSWMKKRDLVSKNEEEIVREWREYFARNFVLSKYPQGDEKIDREIESLMDGMNELFNKKGYQKKLEDLFTKSKAKSFSFVKSIPTSEAFTEEQRKKITNRIEGIQLYWMKDFKTSKFKSQPLEFLDWGIAYDPVSNEINVGINSMAYPNDESFIAVFAHEIGHAFDSCRWGAYLAQSPKEIWPFQKIGDCLRSESSVNAKKRDDSKLDALAKVNSELALSLKQNPTCNKTVYPPIGVQADQLPESFADWFSTEVMATFEDIKPSLLRLDLCKQTELNPGSSYPTNDRRLNAIYFAHPKFKSARADDKAKSASYCSW